MNYLSASEWNDYLNELNNMGDTFFTHPITWLRTKTQLDRWKESNEEALTETIELVCMPNYNIQRTWPITHETLSGEIDFQSIQIFFNKTYLKNLGYLKDTGEFDYNPDFDRFIIGGKKYKPFGDTDGDSINLPQHDAVYLLVLKRDIKNNTE